MSTAATIVSTQRLALGVVPVDVLSNKILSHAVRMEIETDIPHVSGNTNKRQFSYRREARRAPSGLLRHPSGRYSLQYNDSIPPEIVLRIYDLKRHCIPRRLRLPLLPLADVLVREASETDNYMADRSCRAMLFPGSAYPMTRLVGVRGRVIRGGEPVRWAIVTGVFTDSAITVRARCDDRGEFILVIPPSAVIDSELPESVELNLKAHVPGVTVPTAVPVQRADPYWDVPIEQAGGVNPNDPVLQGLEVPTGFDESSSTTSLTILTDRLSLSRDVGDVEFTP